MTQTQQVIDLLRTNGEHGLTPLEALYAVGSFRLAARISEAREEIGPDEEIVTERVTTESGAVVAKYVLRRRTVVPPQQVGLWDGTR